MGKYAHEIARYPDECLAEKAPLRTFNSALIELGAGSGKKMRALLDATEQMPQQDGVVCTYCPCDYSSGALEENASVYNRFEERGANMKMKPFVGTNEEALKLQIEGRKTFIFLGNSIGQDLDPVPFLSSIMAQCQEKDRLLLGCDVAAYEPRKPASVINEAYNDAAGVTAEFILNALCVVNKVVGHEMNFRAKDWKMIAEYSEERQAMEIFTEAVRDVDVSMTGLDGATELVRRFVCGDRIFVEQSGKWSPEYIEEVARASNMTMTRSWDDSRGYFRLCEFIRTSKCTGASED